MKATPKHVLAAVILVLSLAAPVAAGPIDDAFAAEGRGDYVTAARLFRPLADQGNARAQTNLGSYYAAGRGVPKDYAEAVKWYRRAADQGDAAGQALLGVVYSLGEGVPQNYAEAAKWYRLSADQGFANAQDVLASMYFVGKGVPQSFVQAHMWFNLSAAQGNKDAEKTRDRIEIMMTPAQIAEAQKLAREWKPTIQPPR